MRSLNLALVLLALSFTSSAQLRLQAPPPTAPKLIHAGRILDITKATYLVDQGILTDGEKIKEIGPWPEVQRRASADIVGIDLSDATLLPGLIDCHTHLLISGDLGRLDPTELVVTTLTQMSVSTRALLGARNARETLEAGITSARILGHSGIDGDVALRDAINAGWIPGPRLQAAARKIAAPGVMSLPAGTGMQILSQEFLMVIGPDQARTAVRENLAAGADLIKIAIDSDAARNGRTRYLAPEDAKAIVDEAHRSGVKVAAHAADNQAVQIAIDAGVDSIEHAWSATDEQLKQMKGKGIFLVATEIYTNKPPKERLQRAIKIGVRIAMGSDAWALMPGKTRGEASLFELKKLQDEGMENIEIIRSCTTNAAELMGWSERVGEIAVGKFADIVAVTGDPIANIALLQHVQFVMKGGTVVRNEFRKH
jgi:imidazolonepropionase-like amidohydrolase